MTAPRGKVEASLAERGRPAMWATEAEAAALSGYSEDQFRKERGALERLGFPQVSRLNGKRHIPSILNFWAAQVDSAPVSGPTLVEDEDGPQVEKFHGRPQRRVS